MENSTLLVIMAVFTGVAAVALLLQMVFLFLIFRATQAMQIRASTFMDRWEPVAETTQQTLEELRSDTRQLLKQAQELTETAKAQIEKADAVLTDVSDSARVQLERVDRTVQEVLERIHETTQALQKVVLVPVKQFHAIASGISASLNTLFGGRRASVDQATLDEEMFI
jgi:uncharacterized protein YoxC